MCAVHQVDTKSFPVEFTPSQQRLVGRIDIHQPDYKGCYAISVLHSKEDGLFRGIDIDKAFRDKHVIQENPAVKDGARVNKFKTGSDTFGTIFLRFDSQEEMHREMADPSRWLKLKIDSAE